MFEITYDIDITPLLVYVNKIENELKEASELKNSVQAAGDYFVQEWINHSQSKFKHSEGGYAKGIVDGVEYPHNDNPLAYKIRHTSKVATYLEEGTQSFDMKKALFTSDKVRITKEGKRYLIIPFRHGTPGSRRNPMPKEVYSEAKNLKPSAIIGKYQEGSIKDAADIYDAELLKAFNRVRVTRNEYEWGGKLTHIAGKELPDKSIYKNMVRFQQNPNLNRARFSLGKFTVNLHNETENFQDYTAYMTFRAMVEGADGWIHPGIKPMNILGETIAKTKDKIIQTLALGAKMDMERALKAIS